MNEQAGIDRLRENLFAALEGLKNKTIDVATAKAISDVSQTIINTAKVELDFQQHHKLNMNSAFFHIASDQATPAIGNHETQASTNASGKSANAANKNDDNITVTKHGIKEIKGPVTIHRMT